MATAVQCAACPLSLASRGRCAFTQTHVPADEVIFSQGEAWDRACFVREGLLALTCISQDGEERSFAIRGPRTLLGAQALDGTGSASEVRALTDVKLCVLSAEQFATWLGPDHTPARAVLGFLLAELEQRQADSRWRVGECDARVARLALACDDAQPADGFPIRQKQQMARLLGMRAETFSRSLRRLSEQGLLNARTLRVRDRGGLQSVARTTDP